MSIATSTGALPRIDGLFSVPPLSAELSTGRKVLAFGTMCLGCFVAYADLPITITSIQEAGGGVAASQVELSWMMTSYLIAEIITIALAAWLSRVISTRWLLTASAAGLAVASALVSAAWDIRSMIVFRALQGFFAGAMIPTAQTAAVILFRDKKSAAVAISVVAAIGGLAPTLGPVLSGWITESFSWRWIYYVHLVVGTIMLISVPILVNIDKADLTLLRGADYLGMALIAISLGTLDYVLQEGYRWHWFNDKTITTCALVSAVSGIAFVIRTLNHAQPIVDLHALRNRNFCLGCLFSVVTGIGIVSVFQLTVLFLGRVRGFIAWQNGDTILWAGLFQLSAIPLYIATNRHLDLRWLLVFGLACFSISLWLFKPIMNQWQWQEMLVPLALRGVAVAFALPAITTLALGGLAPDRVASASGLFALTRSLGGVIGITGCGIVLNDRTNLHFVRIAEHLTATNSALTDRLHGMTMHYAQTVGNIVNGHGAALKKLWLLTFREAQVEAFADAYLVVAVCLGFSIIIVPLIRDIRVRSGQ
jgi:MFS transporter, DHA2 family, multidrug resistance protein